MLGFDFAGVDLLIGPDGYLFSEANPAPGFRVDPEQPRSYDIAKELFDFIAPR